MPCLTDKSVSCFVIFYLITKRLFVASVRNSFADPTPERVTSSCQLVKVRDGFSDFVTQIMISFAITDQKIRLFDTTNGDFKDFKEIRARNVGWSVLDTQISPDSQHLIYSSWCDYIHQINIYGEEERHVALPLSPGDGRFCLFSLRFSEDGLEILGGANDGYLYLFDRIGHEESLKINAHDDDVNAVAFADTTTHILASGGDDGLCKIWDRRSLRESNPVPVGVLAGHVDGITYIDPRYTGIHAQLSSH